jgi:hypothetical protein
LSTRFPGISADPAALCGDDVRGDRDSTRGDAISYFGSLGVDSGRRSWHGATNEAERGAGGLLHPNGQRGFLREFANIGSVTVVGTARALQSDVSNKTRFFTIVLGVTALAGLTYGVTRRGLPRRAVQALGNHPLASNQFVASSALGLAQANNLPAPSVPDWETLTVHGTRGAAPDALDLAMNLDGIFDVESEDGGALTVRPSEHVPVPVGGDDEEAPSADDLGRTWLAQATQAEQSVIQADLIPEIDEIAFADETDADEADADETDADEVDADEHADFRRTRA